MATTTHTIADRYELAERIGSGGGGSVWRARDTELDRTVAVKLVPVAGDLTDAERDRARTRVAREARATARLQHPAIPPVFDTVIGDEHVAIVLGYVDAPNLRQRISARGLLDDDQATDLARQLVDVLAAAHHAGVVHRDIKPSNVLLTEDGEVKLTDFGIASVGDETRLTRTGQTVGSPAYLAPEQARGQDPTPAVDLWGLGATLYFALDGASPFDRGRPLPSLHAVLYDDPEPPRRDTALWPLIAWLLAKHPSLRPDVDEIREYLRDPEAGAAALRERRTQTVPLPDVDGAAEAAAAAGAGAGAAAVGATGTGRPAVETQGLVGARQPTAGSSAPARRWVVTALVVLLGAAGLVLWSGGTTDRPEADEGTDTGGTQQVELDADPEQEVDPEQDPAITDGDAQVDGEPQGEATSGGPDRGPDGEGPPGQDGPPGQGDPPGRDGAPGAGNAHGRG